MQPCGDPECEYPANPDPSISDGFCCEKCEGRFNGEEWANSGKKKHTAYCTSKDDSLMEMGGGGAASAGGGFGSVDGKCANPECEYMKHSDPFYSQLYCCEKCEGSHTGADWAEGGKKHYKHCEKIEASESGGGYGGGSGFGGGFGCGGGGGYGCGAYGKAAGGKGKWMQGPYGGYGGKAMCAGGFGKGCGKAIPSWQGAISPIAKVSGLKKGGGKVKATGPSLKDFEADQKVWVGNLPESATINEIKEHFGLIGGTVKFAAIMKGGTGGVAFETAEQAAEAIIVLNNSGFGDQAIQVDVWSGK